MKTFFLLFCFALLGLAGFRPVAETTLTGTITDQNTREPLIGATVRVTKDRNLIKGTITDVNGTYKVALDPGVYEVEFSYTGYTSQRITEVRVQAGQKNTLDAALSAGAVLNECVVVEYKEPIIRKDEISSGITLSETRITPRSKASAPKKSRKAGKEAPKSTAPGKVAATPAPTTPPPPPAEAPVREAEKEGPPPETAPERPLAPGEGFVVVEGVRRRVRIAFDPETYEERVETVDDVTGEPVADKATEAMPETHDLELPAEASVTDEPPAISTDPAPRAGLLTAGEWSDLYNWNTHWLDLLTDGEISQYQTTYGFFPKNRYPVLLTNDQNFPVADAAVQLRTASGEMVWEARTDNTGKAELWAGLFDQKEFATLQVVALVNGRQYDLGQPKPAKDGFNRHQISVDCQAPKNVDIVWAVDATGSMGDEIEYLKTELLDVIGRAKSRNPELAFRMGTVFYRDQGDEYVTKSSGLSPDIAQTVAFIRKQFAGGGGDYPEAVHSALEEAIFNQQWSENAISRICFLVLDASPHLSAEVNASLQRSIREAARRGIRIVPVTASGIQKDTEFLMKFFGLATNGTYVFLTDHSGIGGHHIEPTTDEYKVEALNDLLLRLITEYTTIKTCSGQSAIRFDDPQARPNQPVATWQALYYPNPADTQFNIDLPFAVQSVTIYNSEGQAVRKLEQPQEGLHNVIVSDLAPGFYTIRILKDGQAQSGKLMILR